MNKTDYWVTYYVENNSNDEDRMIDIVNYYDLNKLLDLVLNNKVYGLYMTNSAARPAIPIDYDTAKALKMVVSDFHDSALQSLQAELTD